jgi:hypothetical protein
VGAGVRRVEIGRVARAVLSVEFDYEEGANGSHMPVLRNVLIEGVTTESGVTPGRRSFLALPWAIHWRAFGPFFEMAYLSAIRT